MGAENVFDNKITKLIQGDCRDVLAALPDQSVHMCVTSPPYWGLRSYTGAGATVWGGETGHTHEWGGEVSGNDRHAYRPETSGKHAYEASELLGAAARGNLCPCGAWRGVLGSEPTPELYVEHIVEVFRAVKRVLRDDGTLWLNLGPTWAGTGSGKYPNQQRVFDNSIQATNAHSEFASQRLDDWPAKCMVPIPWMVGLALIADGWILRSEIIWDKPAPMPESVTDRPTKSHEQILLLAKQGRYFYDAEAIKEPSRNARSVWRIAPEPSRLEHTRPVQAQEPEKHYAMFPSGLPRRCILAGTSERGCCPECGAQWVRQVVKSGGSTGQGWHDHKDDGIRGQRAKDPASKGGHGYKVETVGWAASCAHGLPEGCLPDDLEIIETPTGERVGDDPTLLTGRAGMNRPRGLNEGSRPITRYEQRRYAEQLRNSPHRAEMAAACGTAFDHYIRTDRSSARPLPVDLLERWLANGWLTPVVIPDIQPLSPVPCTVLDLFAGTATTLATAQELGRRSIGVELSADYTAMAARRLGKVSMSFAGA